ncbi:MAG: hypothetical protein HQM08_23175 [Candidatus Riflebacteria bacterium]|nr:hypothetical protein [Candidatus Riflebacteria bacterium]
MGTKGRFRGGLIFIFFFLNTIFYCCYLFLNSIFLLLDIKKISSLKDSLHKTRSEEEYQNYLLVNGVPLPNISKNLIRTFYLNEKNLGNDLWREKVSKCPNQSSVRQMLVNLLIKYDDFMPVAKFFACKQLFGWAKNYEEKSFLIMLAIDTYLKQIIPFGPLEFSEFSLFLPEIEWFILKSLNDKKDITLLKKKIVLAIERIDKIPLVNYEFKRIFYLSTYFKYFNFLCDQNNENLQSLTVSINQCIEVSERYLILWNLLGLKRQVQTSSSFVMACLEMYT